MALLFVAAVGKLKIPFSFLMERLMYYVGTQKSIQCSVYSNLVVLILKQISYLLLCKGCVRVRQNIKNGKSGICATQICVFEYQLYRVISVRVQVLSALAFNDDESISAKTSSLCPV
jgi:hypothetical protein